MANRFVWLSLVLLLIGGCVKHDPSLQSFVPKPSFSGRILVMSVSHRFQLDIDWASSGNTGDMRLTHGVSGRIVEVVWQGKRMRWRDNKDAPTWQNLTETALIELGVILPPWMLTKVFLGQLPTSMQTTDGRKWKGKWGANDLQIRWASEQQRVELVDIKNGRRVVVVFNE